MYIDIQHQLQCTIPTPSYLKKTWHFTNQMTVKRLYLASTTAKKSKTMPKAKSRSKAIKQVPRDLARLGKGFPKRLEMTHRYVETIAVQSTTGTQQRYIFSANGMYDPNISSTGTQPYYFDQVAALYNHFCVLKSRIKITCNLANSSQPSCLITLAGNDDTTVTNQTFQGQAMMPATTYGLLSNVENRVVLYQYFDAAKVFGGDPESNSEIFGSAGGNPAEQWYWIIGVQEQSQSLTSIVNIIADIEYTAVWDELKDVVVS